jgi:amino acid permease
MNLYARVMKYSFPVSHQVGDYYMDYKDVLDIRVYIPMLLVVLIPIGLIRNLKYLVPFSAVANFFILVSFVITLYYIFSNTLKVSDKEYIANVEQIPLFLSTVIFAMEGIGVVSSLTGVILVSSGNLGNEIMLRRRVKQ